MPEQLTTKRKAEKPYHRLIDVPITKKLQKASSQPTLKRPASAIDSSLSESPPPPSLTSGSSIEDSPSSTANSLVDKSSASTASIEKSSPSATRASPTSMLQDTRPNHGGAQETELLSWDELFAMSGEELVAYRKLRGWKDPLEQDLGSEYDSADDFYEQEIYAYEMNHVQDVR